MSHIFWKASITDNLSVWAASLKAFSDDWEIEAFFPSLIVNETTYDLLLLIPLSLISGIEANSWEIIIPKILQKYTGFDSIC